MSMLTQIFGVGQSTSVTQQQTTSSQQQPQADNRGSEYLSKFSSGQTVEGKITGIKGNEVQIELPNGGQVNAKLDNAMALQPGQTLTFEVRSNSANQISLTPLYTNLTMDPTAAKALAAAGMAVNADTLAMTGAMMDAGMNIDKASLGDMYHLLSSFPGQDINNMVEMQKLGLPVNEQTIEQYSAFKNYENQISEGMKEISEQALSLYEELAGEEGSPEATHFMRQLTDLFAKELPGETAADLPKDLVQTDPETGKVILQSQGAQLEQGLLTELSDLMDKAAAMPEKEAALQPEVKEVIEQLKMAQAENGTDKTAAEQVKQSIEKIITKLAPDSSLAADVGKLAATDAQMLKLSNTLLKTLDANGGEIANKALEGQLKELFQSPAFKEVVKNAMKDTWMLRPEQVGDKANVENLYQKLTLQSKELTEMLQQIAKPESGLAQSLGNMSNNLDFMNQMNQAMQYVQLPLKMSGSEATGDLYVYSDKKSLANNDGNVSAMLHLDMQYLGTVDVYAAISPGNQVSTKFYLESDEVMDLIEAHIDELNDRLANRGYSVRSEVKKHSDADETSGKIRSLTAPTATARPVLKQSFDVRA